MSSSYHFPAGSLRNKRVVRASYCQDVFKITFFFFFFNSQQQLAAASGITVEF